MRRCFFILTFVCAVVLRAYPQTMSQPAARFTFDNRQLDDDIQGIVAQPVGTIFVRDRFGNANSALFLGGNAYSYINLGTSRQLKPMKGSVSLWFNLGEGVPAGKGPKYNPILLTKYTAWDDFYETYGIYYMLESQKLVAVSSQDSTREVCAHSIDPFEKNEWRHLVITFDYDSLGFYIDGELQQRSLRDFPMQYLSSDSVVIGTCANKKNARFLNGTVDDIAFYHHVLSPREILDLYHAPNPNRARVQAYWILGSTALLLLFLALYFSIRYRVNVKHKKEKERLELYNLVLETELRVNRALMNPHFVFNSLNALHNFILKNENDRADRYLVKFAKLLRRLLESNTSNLISLEMEIEILERYLEIEDLRFEENIRHHIHIAPGMVPSAIHIPVMMIQPFVENAIWHGLLKQPGEKILKIAFAMPNPHQLECTIDDNGLGRTQPKGHEPIKTSLGTNFVLQRLDLLSKLHQIPCSLIIEDKPNQGGTFVKITLPVLNKKENAYTTTLLHPPL